MEEQNIFRDIPMGKLVAKMCVLIIITMIIQALYNVVDSLFVAQLGLKPLTASRLAYLIQMIMIATSNGIGVGINSVVSRHMGNGDLKKAGRVTGNAITLALIASIIMLLFGLFGFLDLYVTGTAIATISGQILQQLLLLGLCYAKGKRCFYHK